MHEQGLISELQVGMRIPLMSLGHSEIMSLAVPR